jgi:glycosyltransferase involved in cell wall biosynthesis
MTPFAPDEEVADLMKAVDLVALPYRQNSMGRSSLMAALCAGAPVILASSLTDLGPLNEAVCRVPPQSPRMLAQQIKLLLDDPLRTKELGLAGRQAWEQNFSWPVIAENHLQVYQKVLQSGTSYDFDRLESDLPDSLKIL